MLRRYYTHICCFRLTAVQHNKNSFAQETTTRSIAQVNQPNVHAKKRRFCTVQHNLYFLISILQKK